MAGTSVYVLNMKARQRMWPAALLCYLAPLALNMLGCSRDDHMRLTTTEVTLVQSQARGERKSLLITFCLTKLCCGSNQRVGRQIYLGATLYFLCIILFSQRSLLHFFLFMLMMLNSTLQINILVPVVFTMNWQCYVSHSSSVVIYCKVANRSLSCLVAIVRLIMKVQI